jgi:hypothetical protein
MRGRYPSASPGKNDQENEKGNVRENTNALPLSVSSKSHIASSSVSHHCSFCEEVRTLKSSCARAQLKRTMQVDASMKTDLTR